MKHLDPSKVHEKFRSLVLLAEKWGDEDDVYSKHMLENSSIEDIEELVSVVVKNDEALDEWLAGPEAQNKPSAEYIAFTSLRLVADMADVCLEKRRNSPHNSSR